MLRAGMFIDNETESNFIEDDEDSEYTAWVTVSFATYPEMTPKHKDEDLIKFLSDHMRHRDCRITDEAQHHRYTWCLSIAVYSERHLDSLEIVDLAIEECDFYGKEIREGHISIDRERVFRGDAPKPGTMPLDTSFDLLDRILGEPL